MIQHHNSTNVESQYHCVLKETNMEKLFTVNEVSEMLKISNSFLYKLSERSEIGSIKIGASLRFSEQNIKEFILKNERKS